MSRTSPSVHHLWVRSRSSWTHDHAVGTHLRLSNPCNAQGAGCARKQRRQICLVRLGLYQRVRMRIDTHSLAITRFDPLSSVEVYAHKNQIPWVSVGSWSRPVWRTTPCLASQWWHVDDVWTWQHFGCDSTLQDTQCTKRSSPRHDRRKRQPPIFRQPSRAHWQTSIKLQLGKANLVFGSWVRPCYLFTVSWLEPRISRCAPRSLFPQQPDVHGHLCYSFTRRAERERGLHLVTNAGSSLGFRSSHSVG